MNTTQHWQAVIADSFASILLTDSDNSSLRHSLQKRTHNSYLDAGDDETQDEPRMAVAQKYRAIEHADADTPAKAPNARWSTVPMGDTPGSQALARSTPTTAQQSSTATPTLSHEDPVPADCCLQCRPRGGNYAYTSESAQPSNAALDRKPEEVSEERRLVPRTLTSSTLPSRARRTTRQSTAAVNLSQDGGDNPSFTEIVRAASAAGQEYNPRLNRSVALPTGADGTGMPAQPDLARSDNSLVRGSRSTSRQNNNFPHLVLQEPSPEDSAAEDMETISATGNAKDSELANLHLMTENVHVLTPPVAIAAEHETQNYDTMHVIIPECSNSSDEETCGSYRPRVAAVIQQSSQQEARKDDDETDDDDVWNIPASEGEGKVDEIEELNMAVESLSDEAEDLDGLEYSENMILVDVQTGPATALQRKPRAKIPKQHKGLDLNLPPIDTPRDAVADMALRAVGLGLGDVLKKLRGRTINVATMCSGTESPLIFLEMLKEALESKGDGPLMYRHHFSAEIDATKQAYIERNFQPSIIFRDVRQLGDETATTATTAYGAEEPIPGSMDIVIVGFVCKDLSSMNNKRRSVDDQGETGDTWRAVYYYAKKFQPGIVLLENVKADRRLWDDVVCRWRGVGYEAAWIYADTKNHILPQTRERMYMIAINRMLYGEGVNEAARQWRYAMEKMQRQCSSCYEDWLAKLPVSVTEHSTLSSEPDWSLCKLRYDQIRSQQMLGTRRPITQWNESGNLHPPDFANRRWYDSQSSRVYDAIDVAHLQSAQEGYDSMYKMKIWDVSQNVDRFKTGMGLMPCITPGGCDFASNRQDALSGIQALVLQGMPLDKLHFAGETQRELQDLAGNAMSTTVIGASLISAIIHGHKAFQRNSSTNPMNSESPARPHVLSQLVQAQAMGVRSSYLTEPSNIDIAKLLNEAKLSTLHALHVLRIHVTNEFVKSWKQRLPPRLELQKFPLLSKSFPQLRKGREIDTAYIKTIDNIGIGSQRFIMSKFLRDDNAWDVVYVGNGSQMVLSIGDEVQWFLFVDCPPRVPGNSKLRQVLRSPVARAIVHQSLLEVEWELFVPSNGRHLLQICGSAERSKSWRNHKLGLPGYQSETVPTHIHIHGTHKDTDALEGSYTHLPHCGTAESSLYKRSTQPELYFFLDPDPIGEARHDSFVFSVDCSRKLRGRSRMIDAQLDSAWRLYDMSDINKQHNVGVVCTGFWMTLTTTTTIVTSPLDTTARVLMPKTPLVVLQNECTDAFCILDAYIPEELRIGKFSDYSWALEQVKSAPLLDDWQPICIDRQGDCTCAPAYPGLIWSVDGAGKATPHEDRKAAATFERGIKYRCPIFHVHPTVSRNRTRVQVGLNTFSLAHRAKRRLVHSMNSAEPVSSGWRLVTDHTDVKPLLFRKFRLRSNATDTPFSGPLRLEKELRGAQPRALAWMRAQETGVSLTIMEIEEAVHPDLEWRAEARAQTTVKIRGGVLADLPSFGKTVITIALIQSELEVLPSGASILNQHQSAAKDVPQLIETAATLIVCPPHIAMQWQTELQLFLGDEQYERFNVCVIRDFKELISLTIDDLKQSRVIIVSWNVLSGDEYISELALVTAMPEPARSSCRAFDAWMDAMSRDLPAQILKFQSMNMSEFKHAAQTLLLYRLQQPEFQATLPLKVQQGSRYQSYEAVRAAGSAKQSTKCKSAQRRKSSSSHSRVIPLFHMFRFNRIVVDEYHYLGDYKKLKNMFTAISVKKISAHKRWILSGTPALANFTDVDNIASFLGVQLGRFAVGAGKRTALEDFLIDNQTSVESFLSKTEVMSRQWHQARHERAQGFLDLFVRQNEASLDHIPCHEELRALELDVTHHAVYLELSKHLISQRMQVKRLRNKTESDRTSRLNASLNNSRTAEDALLKAALIGEEDMSLSNLLEKRLNQRQGIEAEITRSMRAFEWYRHTGFKGLKPTDPKKAAKEENAVPKLYTAFREDIKKNAWLGDGDVITIAKLLLQAAEKNPLPGGLEELKDVSQVERIKAAKIIISSLRESCTELVAQERSVRFIESVQQLLQTLQHGADQLVSCNAKNCRRTVTISDMYLASQCGHLTCEPCVMARGDDENCVVHGCNCMVQAMNLIKATDLGSTTNATVGQRFGRKMDSIVRLIKKFPSDDQGLLFAPSDEMVATLGEALDHYNIPFNTPSGCNARQAAKIIEEFKNSVNKDATDRPKVLLLNLASETAAGVNLTNANHVIFVSPLLVESQYKYDAAMTQAIARSRRYGQEKKVHIYHFAALRTIDVDILEHRHKRTNGITSAKSTIRMPSTPLAAREKTKLVKSKQGSVALVPISWLADANVRKGLDVGDNPEQFTSLISFSATFEDDEN
ncbi:hypothetical protein SVAN01_02222 [Stagonosporopsis vannaccii]|nr:hypothetical protein SVAN01_02222 [Stagonosporopsis vannaccii]